MIIPINSNKDIIFKQYLNILNPILGPNKLTTSEIEVFSRFLLVKSAYFNLSPEVLKVVLFNAATKKQIREAIKDESGITLSEASFNNILLSLRKKKFIKDNEIAHNPSFDKDGNITITFNLIVNATKQG